MHVLRVGARKRGLTEFTSEVREWLSRQPIATGLLTLFCRHTSAALTLNENASPDVRADLRRWLDTAVPEDADWEVSHLEFEYNRGSAR